MLNVNYDVQICKFLARLVANLQISHTSISYHKTQLMLLRKVGFEFELTDQRGMKCM